VVSALLVLFGAFWRAALVAAFVLYLSLVSASQVFLSFQWDYLLLETGFLAIFLGYSRSIVWLFRWLLFRLMFFSGAVKLLSGDPSWRNLTALTFHYQTQPIPTPFAWYAQQLPVWYQKLSCLGVFVIELGVPFLIFAPRRVRRSAAWCLIALQLLILLTGNYAFFNLLAVALCLFLFDDRSLARLLPGRAFRPLRPWTPPRLRSAIAWGIVVVILVLSGLTSAEQLSRRQLPDAAKSLLSTVGPFGIVNSYGLFAVMTTTRAEIIVEGSNDGVTWLPYEFKYKPGRLDRRPPWVAPHQPRLDWQMWFAALGSYQRNIWFLNLVARMLEGRSEVLALLDRNPFPGQPPELIQARVYEYRFTDSQARHATGNYWTRDLIGTYLPPVDLNALRELPILKRE
jgi:lipase maturation factor 1